MVDFVHTLTIERPFGVDDNADLDVDLDDYGQPIREYDEAFAEIRGLIQPKTAREQALTSQAGAELGDHTIYLLRQDITTRDRLLDTTPGGSGSRYEIVGIRDHNFGSLAHLALDARRITSPAVELGDYAAAVLADAPVAYWRLGEASGNPQDSAGTNHVTTVTGTPTYGVVGAISGNTAMTFDGVGEFLTVPDAAALDLGDVFSVEFWFKRPAITGVTYDPVMDKGSTGGDAYLVYLSTADEMRLAASGAGTVIVQSDFALTALDTWYHVVITKNGSTRALYVDGVDRTSLQTNVTLANSTVNLRLGASLFDVGFPGTLDEIALYDYALSAARIAAHYEIGS